MATHICKYIKTTELQAFDMAELHAMWITFQQKL